MVRSGKFSVFGFQAGGGFGAGGGDEVGGDVGFGHPLAVNPALELAFVDKPISGVIRGEIGLNPRDHSVAFDGNAGVVDVIQRDHPADFESPGLDGCNELAPENAGAALFSVVGALGSADLLGAIGGALFATLLVLLGLLAGIGVDVGEGDG